MGDRQAPSEAKAEVMGKGQVAQTKEFGITLGARGSHGGIFKEIIFVC